MPLINPLGKRRCPYCFEPIRLGDCIIVSRRQSGQTLSPLLDTPAPIRAVFSPMPVRKVLLRFWVPRLNGPAFTSWVAARQCPQCKQTLPHDFERMGNHVIAVIGGAGSGKSHYLAALIRDLERTDILRQFGCTEFQAASTEIVQRYETEYYDPLFRRREILAKTSVVRGASPLVYTMTFKTGRRSKRVHLTTFDVAGENLQDDRAMMEYARFILHASAIIFLVDPMKMDELVEELSDPMRQAGEAASARGSETFRILDIVKDQYRRNKRLLPGSTLGVPIALTLAKSDIMRVFPKFRNYTFMTESQRSGTDRLTELELIDSEVRAVMADFDQATLRSSEAFSNAGFSAVTATGCFPVNDHFKTVLPVRCADPLLWTLWKLGIIKAQSLPEVRSTVVVSQARVRS